MDHCHINRWQQLKMRLQNLSPLEFKNLFESVPESILLDCRTPNEYAFSRIEGARNFDYLSKDFVANMESLDPSATYLVYCRSERRSLRTCTLLQNGGFTNIYNLDGGLINWTKVFGESSLDRSLLKVI